MTPRQRAQTLYREKLKERGYKQKIVWFSPEELVTLEKKASKTGMTPTKFMKYAALSCDSPTQ